MLTAILAGMRLLRCKDEIPGIKLDYAGYLAPTEQLIQMDYYQILAGSEINNIPITIIVIEEISRSFHNL